MKLKIHSSAQKQLSRAPQKIKKKAGSLVAFVLKNDNFYNSPFVVKKLKGNLNIYSEVLLDDDYRILFRIDSENTFYIRKAGTHNYLGTG